MTGPTGKKTKNEEEEEKRRENHRSLSDNYIEKITGL